mgnify:CR=1 FL=1
MAKKDRTGNRKTRDQRKQFKTPELGYYLIVTVQKLQNAAFSPVYIRQCRKM